MNDPHTLNQLRKLSQADYDQKRQTLVQLIQTETSLRNELARLQALGRGADVSSPDLLAMKALGADLLWQGWLGRAKATLNMRLAQVLAQKGHEQAKVRKAFGKVMALDALLREAETAQKKNAQQNALRQMTEHVALHPDQRHQ